MDPSSTSLTRDVNIVHRPSTGMRSVPTTTSQHNRRVVRDLTYYLTQVRNKLNELRVEKEKLLQVISTSETDKKTSTMLLKQESQLKTEITIKDSELSLHNVILENINKENIRVKLERDLNDLQDECAALESECESVFGRKKDKEEYVVSLHHKKRELESHFYKLLSSSSAEKEQYEVVMESINSVENDTNNMYMVLNNQKIKLSELKSVIEKDLKKINYLNRLEEKQELLVTLKKYEKELKSSENKCNVVEMDIANVKKVVKGMGSRISSLESEKKRVIRSIRKSTALLNAFEDENGVYKKIMKLKQKNEDLELYLKENPINLKNIRTNYIKNQKIIIKLLAFMSKSNDNVLMERNRIDVKVSTVEEAKLELQNKKSDFQELINISKKAYKKINNITSSITKMKRELETYNLFISNSDNDTSQLSQQNNIELKNIEMKIERLEKMKKNQINYIHKLQRIKDKNQKKMDFSQLENIKDTEMKIKKYKQNNHMIVQGIEKKREVMDYDDLKFECLDITNELNQLLIKANDDNI